MYAFISGTLAYCNGSFAVLDVGGVGYQVFAPTRTLSNLTVGQKATLYTHLVVREDELSLYGFESDGEKLMFERLISVSGIGPKVGLAVLSTLTPYEISSALLGGDVDTFCSVSGIGKKTAQRIVLELRDKVDLDQITSSVPLGTNAAEEATQALMSLGYSRSEAISAVGAVQNLADSAEDITLLALKRLSL